MTYTFGFRIIVTVWLYEKGTLDKGQADFLKTNE